MAEIDGFEDFGKVLTALDWFLPEVLREIHAEWNHESLDGIFPAFARKTADDEIEIIGMCILISDQTLTPVHLRLQLAQECDAVSWLECWLGESIGEGMLRIPFSSSVIYSGALYAIPGRLDSIDWVYHVAYGDRRGVARDLDPV